MLGYLDFLFLGYSGRIGRGVYWISLMVLAVAQFLAIWGIIGLATPGLEALIPANGEIDEAILGELMLRLVLPGLIISCLFLYPTYAVTTKRWHDRDKSGWWSLIGLVPLIGGLWMLIECGFLGGTEGTNSFGPDPAYG